MTESELIKTTSDDVERRFQSKPERIFLSPGRINIIGEHVDYNDGFVLPAAIDKYIVFAFTPISGDTSTIVAKDLNDEHEIAMTETVKPIEKMWANYLLGVLYQMKQQNHTIGAFNIVFASNIPIGAGLSSSAALECGFGFALNEVYNLGYSKQEIALIGQKSEHTFVGVMCGIMDQFASVFGKAGNVIKLDCTSLEYEYHKADFTNYSVLLLDSHVKHTHLTSGYNTRREEVEKGLSILKEMYPGINTFRDVKSDQIESAKQQLGEVIYRRCHFVVSEIQRVLDAVEALEKDDLNQLGELMFATHDGLSKEYEVSCEEIDFLVAAAKNEPDILGARMMGGGFGGCSINLVKKGREDAIISKFSKAYFEKFNIELGAYKVALADGTKEYLA